MFFLKRDNEWWAFFPPYVGLDNIKLPPNSLLDSLDDFQLSNLSVVFSAAFREGRKLGRKEGAEEVRGGILSALGLKEDSS